MSQSNLILILGLPGTGKTTFGKKLAQELNLPFVSKDHFKAAIFDEFGWKDRELSVKAGKVSYGLIDYIIEENLKSEYSLIVESTFDPNFANKKFQDWQKEYGFNSIQILFSADEDVILQRFKDRAKSDTRHVSHVEGADGVRNLKERLAGNLDRALELKGPVIRVDTTSFSHFDESKIVAEVKKALAPLGSPIL